MGWSICIALTITAIFVVATLIGERHRFEIEQLAADLELDDIWTEEELAELKDIIDDHRGD